MICEGGHDQRQRKQFFSFNDLQLHMEKFSAYRDPGTGIQPFLTPVPPLGSELLARVTLPVRYILGFVRTVLILILILAYVLFVQGVCLILVPIPPLYRFVEHILIYILGRTALLILGLFWTSPEQFNRKRGRGTKLAETWKPKAGDIIVSNWASWIEIVWLAIQYNPIFVIPVPESLPETPAASRSSTPIAHTPGRRTGTGSANIQVPLEHLYLVRSTDRPRSYIDTYDTSTSLNPLSHLFLLGTSLSLAEISIRLLAPSESPGSQLFVASEILSDYTGVDELSETCAALIAQMGKMKRTGMGWEDKSNFLEFYRGKSK
ncbi:hypothetical protein BDZ97DRAFT_1911419 [Flammula alnicola]|nr:hypothetical protein BDZ97DRAFT_1911419 [Flammula alnicola]